MSGKQTPKRRVWPWLVGGIGALALVIVGVLVGGLVLGGQQTPPSTEPAPTSSQAAPLGTTSSERPTGCIAGPGRDAATVLEAQRLAPHTTNGAVEFAATQMRAVQQWPVISVEDATALRDSIFASTAAPEFADLPTAVAGNPNTGSYGDGVQWHLSTAPGAWYVEDETPDRVKISVVAGAVIAGQLSPSQYVVTTGVYVWENGAWKMETGSKEYQPSQVLDNGIPFTGGC